MDFQSIALPPELQHRFPFGNAKVAIISEMPNIFELICKKFHQFSLPPSSEAVHGGFQLLKRLGEHTPRAAYVQAHIPLAFHSEHLSVVKGQMSLVYEQVHEFALFQTEFAAVQPYEEGGLREYRVNLRKMLFAPVAGEVGVEIDISEHLVPPLSAFRSVGRPGGYDREEARVVYLIGFKVAEELFAQRLIEDYAV